MFRFIIFHVRNVNNFEADLTYSVYVNDFCPEGEPRWNYIITGECNENKVLIDDTKHINIHSQ